MQTKSWMGMKKVTRVCNISRSEGEEEEAERYLRLEDLVEKQERVGSIIPIARLYG